MRTALVTACQGLVGLTLLSAHPRATLSPKTARSQHVSKVGLYRIIVPDGRECAIVHRDAGDAAPYLPRDIYEAMRFRPRYDTLRLIDSDDALRPLVEHCTDDPMLG